MQKPAGAAGQWSSPETRGRAKSKIWERKSELDETHKITWSSECGYVPMAGREATTNCEAVADHLAYTLLYMFLVAGA